MANGNMIIIGILVILGLFVIGKNDIKETFSVVPQTESLSTSFGHSLSCLREGHNPTDNFLGYDININVVPQIGEVLEVKKNNQVLNSGREYSDNFIDIKYLCTDVERDSFLKISNKKYTDLVNPTVTLTEKSVEFWEGSNNNDLLLSFISPISVSNAKLYYRFTLPEITEGIRPEKEFEKEVQLTEGINEFTINIPQEFVIGDYNVFIQLYTPQQNTRYIERAAENAKIDLITPLKKDFLIVPRPIYLILEKGDVCPPKHYVESTTTEHTLVCVRNDLKDLGCVRLGVPVDEVYSYTCTSTGIPAEIIYQPVKCLSDIQCQSYNLDKCEIDSGVCYKKEIYNNLFQCTSSADIPIPCRGITGECIDGKIKYSGECLIEETPQAISLINFKTIEISSQTFDLEFPHLVTKGIMSISRENDCDVKVLINNEFSAVLDLKPSGELFSIEKEFNFRNNFFKPIDNSISVKCDDKNINFNLKLFEKHLCEIDEDVYCPITKSLGTCIDFTPICEQEIKTEVSDSGTIVSETETKPESKGVGKGVIYGILGILGIGIILRMAKKI